MSLISTTIPNLINGVSQQPYVMRLASQAEDQVNGLSSVVDGLLKRPPTRHSAKILNTPLDSAFTHKINRDASERYEMIITNGNLQVFDLNGYPKTVNFPQGTGYLASGNPAGDFTAVTVADYTFICNKNVVVQRSTSKTPVRPYEALIWVKSGAYKTTYRVLIGATEAVYTTLDSSAEANAASITTDNIANELINQLSTGLPAGYSLSRQGSTIKVRHDTLKFRAEVSDGQGDNALKLIYGSVQNFTDLPAKATNNFKVRIAGGGTNAFDDYWVVYDSTEGGQYDGVWKESTAPEEDDGIAPSTMPHILVREADGTFTFKEATWDKRKVGSLETTPFPSFVGRRINDVFFHRNRLGFLSDENIILSRAGEFFTFFPASVIETVDTDPIDVAVSHVKVSILKHAVPFNESLLLFADQTQFMLGDAELLTPKTISVNQTTEFEANLAAKPVGAGQNVYFAQTRGAFSGVREYFVDSQTETKDAADVTAHCPKYIKGSVVKLAATSNEDMLAVLSSGDRQSLYIYRYYWSGQEKMMSSWSRWEMPAGSTILNMDFIESDLWLTISRPDGVFLEVISLEAGRVDSGSELQVHLDRRMSVTHVNVLLDPLANTTTITLPFNRQPGEDWKVVAWYAPGAMSHKPGQIISGVWNGNSFTFTGQTTSFFVGVSYAFRYVFSTLAIREQTQSGSQAITEGRTQVRGMSLTYASTGYFRVEVTPEFRNTYSYVFAGRVLGSAQNKIGEIPIEEGTFRFPVQSRNDQVAIALVNDSHLPCSFMGAEWEAFFTMRSKRL